jgi:cytochrome c-type biogenesis protein CcmH/NrfG
MTDDARTDAPTDATTDATTVAPVETVDEDLEAQREFLLRSLDDLDDELLAGNIDPDNYRILHDDYTARASAVIKEIAAGAHRSTSSGPRVPPLLRLLTYGGIVVFAVLAAILLAHTAGQRRAGQEITGGQGAGPTTTASPARVVADAQAAVTAAPKSYDARIRYARALLSSGNYPDAIKQFLSASNLDPKQPEPLTYAGWLTALVAQQVSDPTSKKELIDVATKNLNSAIRADSTYPDAYVFKGLLLTRIENKQCVGADAFRQFLVYAPDNHPMRPQVLSALAQAVKAGNCPTTSTPTTKP